MQPDNLVIVASAAVTPFGLETSEFSKGTNGDAYEFKEDESLSEYLTDSQVKSSYIPKYDAKKELNTRAVSQLDQLTKHVCIATQKLQKDLGFDSVEERQQKIPDERISLMLGSTGPVQSVVDFDITSYKEPQYVAAGLFPNVVFNVPGCYASIRHGIKGSVLTFNDGDVSSANALKVACGKLNSERCDVAWVGGAEALTPAHALMVKSQQSSIKNSHLSDLAEGVYLFAIMRKQYATDQGYEAIAEIEGTVNLFCPNKPLAIKRTVEKLNNDRPEEMKEISWVSGYTSEVSPLLNYDVKEFKEASKLGYLASATSAAEVMSALASDLVKPGERVLHVCQDENGASSAILFRKVKSI